MFVQKPSKQVKIGYSVSFICGMLSVYSGYQQYKSSGNIMDMAFGLFAFGLVIVFLSMTLYGARKWRHQTLGKGVHKIHITRPSHYKNSVWLHHYAGAIAFLLRLVMRAGFVPVLIGKPGSGKTLILEKTTPGLVYGNTSLILEKTAPGAALGNLKLAGANSGGTEPIIKPGSYFSIEELSHFANNDVAELFLAVRDKNFAISTQDYAILKRFGFEQALMGRRRLLVYLD